MDLRRQWACNGYSGRMHVLPPVFWRWLAHCLVVCGCSWGLPAQAQGFAWDAQALPTTSLGQQVQVLREYGARWSVQEALERFADANPPPPRHEVLSFGIGAAPVWLRLPLHNAEREALRMHLLLGTTWLDSADIYVMRGDKLHRQFHLGDESPYAYGVVPGFGFGWELDLPPQYSTLLVRVQSLDPLVLPLQLLDAGALAAQCDVVQYSYELIFGALFALILYNLALFAVARNHLHARYALYIASMLAMCIAYTGKGLANWWPQSPEFQRYVILCAMVLFNMAGLNFAVHFLQFRRIFPVLGRWLLYAKWAVVATMAVLVVLDRHLAAVWWAFGVFLVCTVLLFGLGLWAVWARRPYGRLFFAAVATSMAGAASAWLAIMGLVGYTTVAFRVMEAGFLVDAVVLAFALGQRVIAEKTAKPATTAGTLAPSQGLR
jgi:hypothetical protein